MNENIFFPDTDTGNAIVESLLFLSSFLNDKMAIALITIFLFCQPAMAAHTALEDTASPVIVMNDYGILTTVSENNGLRIWNRMDELSKLEAGWDGEGSVPMKEGAIRFLQDVISECDDALLKDWVLFPDGRGYLYLDYTHNKDLAGITITDKAFVYFIKKDGKLEKKDNNDLQQETLINILRKVNG